MPRVKSVNDKSPGGNPCSAAERSCHQINSAAAADPVSVDGSEPGRDSAVVSHHNRGARDQGSRFSEAATARLRRRQLLATGEFRLCAARERPPLRGGSGWSARIGGWGGGETRKRASGF